MKIELFVLPEVMRRDFIEAFVPDKEDLRTAQPDLCRRLEAMGMGLDEWYAEAYLWDKLSPELPVVEFETALSLLRSRVGAVLFMSESESPLKSCALIHHGRMVYDFVAVADPRELADRVEYEWREAPRLFTESPEELTLPEDLYVYDTTLEWVIVFTHETAPTAEGMPEGRFCRAFGFGMP